MKIAYHNQLNFTDYLNYTSLTYRSDPESHSVDLLVVGDAVLACGSGIPVTFQRAVPARTLGQIFSSQDCGQVFLVLSFC